MLLQGDCMQRMRELDDASFDAVLTDPPYFIDGHDDGWTRAEAKPTGCVRMPPGMKFDRHQGLRLQEFMGEVGAELLRLLKPGAFCLAFSQPRLVHRMACGLEDAGFEIRDMYAWRYTKKAQQKAASQAHRICGLGLPEDEERELRQAMEGWKTAQLRPNFEPIVVAQKPSEGTLAANFHEHGTGLACFGKAMHDENLTTVFTVEKERKEAWNRHPTVKPVFLLERLLAVFAGGRGRVLDPFLGSGSTALACQRGGYEWVGIERDPNYVKLAGRRLAEELT